MRLLKYPRLLLAAACLAALMAGTVITAERSAKMMATAATAFLDSLSPEQRQKAAFPFDSNDRLRWHFIPTEVFSRRGLLLGEMTEPQRNRARDLIKAALSQRGYLTATAIMDLETTLGDIERRARESGQSAEAMVRDPEKYFFSVFGTPSAAQPWGWRVEGHHVSLHFTVVKSNLVASSPAFFGVNPAEVRDGPKKGLRLLADHEDAARSLLTALDPSQRAKAIIETSAPEDILTFAKVDITPLSPAGITAAAMTPAQRDLLMKLVDVYVSKMAEDIAAERTAKLQKAGVDKIVFAWAGETARGKKHYYRVQGPTFLIEYDNVQNDANHIHSVWRDFNGDFGRDLLREHLAAVIH